MKQAKTIKGTLLFKSVSFTPIQENNFEKGNAYRIHANFRLLELRIINVYEMQTVTEVFSFKICQETI